MSKWFQVVGIFACMLTMLSGMVFAGTQFNVPSCWIMSSSGNSIDSNCDGVVDMCSVASSVGGLNTSTIVNTTMLNDYYNKTQVDSQQSQQNTTIDSKLNITDQRYNDTTLILAVNASRAGIGSCASGQAVQNTTVSGVQCINVSGTSGTSFNYTEYFNQYLNNTNNVSFGTVNATHYGDGSHLTGVAGSYNDSWINASLDLKLNISDQRYNDTAIINSVNTTSNIMALGFYNISADYLNDSLSWCALNGNNNLNGNQTISNGILYINNTEIDFINSTGGLASILYFEEAYKYFRTTSNFRSDGSISAVEDIYTTGSGDDFWLGTSVQSSALFRAYANGILFAGNTTLSTLNVTGESVFSNVTMSRLTVSTLSNELTVNATNIIATNYTGITKPMISSWDGLCNDGYFVKGIDTNFSYCELPTTAVDFNVTGTLYTTNLGTHSGYLCYNATNYAVYVSNTTCELT